MTVVLGLRSKHDATAALVIDGELVAAAAEERFTRRKHYYGFPRNSVEYVLAQAGLKPSQVDLVARDGLPWSKTFTRLARQLSVAWSPRLYGEVLQKGINRFFRQAPDDKSNEESQLQEMGFAPRYHFVEHHLGHAAYAYYAAPLDKATVVVLDGRGHYLGGAVYRGEGKDLHPVSEILAEGGSLGLFYSAVTDALGFQVGDGDGKTMGLACYGDPKVALDDLLPWAPEIEGLKSVRHREWQLETKIVRNRLYGHYGESAQLRLLIDKHGDRNLAAAAQYILEQRLEELIGNVVKATGSRTLVGGGGIFLNIKASKRLIDKDIIDSIYIPPGPGDEGMAAGYALAAYSAVTGQRPAPLHSPYLGPEYSEEQILAELKNFPSLTYERLDNVPEATARLIAEGKVVGWFQGRMEYGPRALGNRSVLADPRDPEMRDRINHLLKKRDWFMPFAPSVLQEYCDECFVKYQSSPYMNLGFEMRPPYDTTVPAIMHVDQTARPQAVDKETNPLYHATIEAFRCLTGIPMVLNTSFNRHGLPIVCTPKDALEHLVDVNIEVLVIGPFLVQRLTQ